MSLRIEDLTMHHARRTEIIPGSRRPNMPQHHLYDHEVGPSTGSALQVVMDDVARTQEQQRLAHRVAQMASDLELCREEQAHTANLAAQREYVLQRQVEQAVQAAKEAEEAHRGTLREAQAAWMRVRELEQLVAFAEADRDEARADKESVIQEITSLREELHTCHLQAQELRSSEASAIRTHQKAADDARSSLARVERERDEAVRALGAEAKAHKLREQKLEAQCEQLRKETERMSTMVDAAEVQRERDRGALALERVMQAAASQEEAWGKELKAALERAKAAEEAAAEVSERQHSQKMEVAGLRSTLASMYAERHQQEAERAASATAAELRTNEALSMQAKSHAVAQELSAACDVLEARLMEESVRRDEAERRLRAIDKDKDLRTPERPPVVRTRSSTSDGEAGSESLRQAALAAPRSDNRASLPGVSLTVDNLMSLLEEEMVKRAESEQRLTASRAAEQRLMAVAEENLSDVDTDTRSQAKRASETNARRNIVAHGGSRTKELSPENTKRASNRWITPVQTPEPGRRYSLATRQKSQNVGSSSFLGAPVARRFSSSPPQTKSPRNTPPKSSRSTSFSSSAPTRRPSQLSPSRSSRRNSLPAIPVYKPKEYKPVRVWRPLSN